MPHAVFFFIIGLPGVLQRCLKAVLFWPILVVALLANKFSEEAAVRVLAWVAMVGVSQADADVAGQYACLRLKQCLRPQLLAALVEHQRQSRCVTILSGNIAPIVRPLATALACQCVCTEVTQFASGRFTGNIAGPAMVRHLKSAHVRQFAQEHPRSNMYGYGNSRNDIPFLQEVGHAHAVTPDRKLRLHARTAGWKDTFFHVDESESLWEVSRQYLHLMRLGTRLCHPKGCYHDRLDRAENVAKKL